MGQEQANKSFFNNLKSQWVSALFLIGAVGVVLNYYTELNTYVKTQASGVIKEELHKHEGEASKRSDSLIQFVLRTHHYPLIKRVENLEVATGMNSFRIDINIDALKAEFDSFRYKGKRFYKSNPNHLGVEQIWCVVEKGGHTYLYSAHYNPTEDLYGYFDENNKYHLVQ